MICGLVSVCRIWCDIVELLQFCSSAIWQLVFMNNHTVTQRSHRVSQREVQCFRYNLTIYQFGNFSISNQSNSIFNQSDSIYGTSNTKTPLQQTFVVVRRAASVRHRGYQQYGLPDKFLLSVLYPRPECTSKVNHG